MKTGLGGLLGDNIVYHGIQKGGAPVSVRIEEAPFPYEIEERNAAYLASRVGNKALKIFEKGK